MSLDDIVGDVRVKRSRLGTYVLGALMAVMSYIGCGDANKTELPPPNNNPPITHLDSGYSNGDMGSILDDDSGYDGGFDKDIGVEDKDVPQYDGGDAGIDIGIPDEDAGDGGIGNDVPEYDAGDGGEDVPQLPDVEKYDGETPDGEFDAGQDGGTDAGVDIGVQDAGDGGTPDAGSCFDFSVSCGKNRRGTQNYICHISDGGVVVSDGGFVYDISACIDPDVCVDNTTTIVTDVCGWNKRGDQPKICYVGQWTDNGGCDDPDVCVDNATTTLPDVCGLNGKGDQPKICYVGQWTNNGSCVDPDVCVNGNVNNNFYPYPTYPGTEGVGECKRGEQTCTNGQWETTKQPVPPKAEICINGKDENCNNVADDGCTTTIDVTVRVTNVVTDATLSGIVVTLNGVPKITNASGITTFTIEPSVTPYPITVRDEDVPGVIGDYNDIETTATLDAPKTLEMQMIENYAVNTTYYPNFLRTLWDFTGTESGNDIGRFASYPVKIFVPEYTNGSGIYYTPLGEQGIQEWEDITSAKPGLQLYQQVATIEEAEGVGIIFDFSQYNSYTSLTIDPDTDNILDGICYIANDWGNASRVLENFKHELGRAMNFSTSTDPEHIMQAGSPLDLPIHSNEGRIAIISATIKDRDMSHQKED